MRALITGFLTLGVAVSALAIDKADVDKRIRTLTIKFDEMQAKPDKRIPPENLRKAQGIILLDRTKGGFVFAYQAGAGMAMVRDAKSGSWSPPSFLRSNEASLGAQIGGQQSFVVILLMNTNATQQLIDSKVNFGGEASGTAGNTSGKAEGDVSDDPSKPMLVYTDAAGLYGGAAVKGGTLSPDIDANVAYYAQSFTAKEILFDRKGTPTQAATDLVQKINQASK